MVDCDWSAEYSTFINAKKIIESSPDMGEIAIYDRIFTKDPEKLL